MESIAKICLLVCEDQHQAKAMCALNALTVEVVCQIKQIVKNIGYAMQTIQRCKEIVLPTNFSSHSEIVEVSTSVINYSF